MKGETDPLSRSTEWVNALSLDLEIFFSAMTGSGGDLKININKTQKLDADISTLTS